MTALILANTQRTIGWVIASIVLVGMGTYILFSFRIGKREVGSEIELAPNRIAHADDDELEMVYKQGMKPSEYLAYK